MSSPLSLGGSASAAHAQGSPAPLSLGGPVSAALEAEVRGWIAKKGVVVWLDLDDHYGAFVDELIAARKRGALPYEVRAFRGSHLELMLSLEGLAGGADRPPLLLHLPGFNEETVKLTPHFALYAAGTRYRKALDTLITEAAAGKVPPDRIAAFLEDGDLELDRADRWLGGLLNEHVGGAAAQLASLPPTAFLDALLAGGADAERYAALDHDLLQDRLAAWLGLPPEWRERALPGWAATAKRKPQELAFLAASWALCVEYVDDRKRPPKSELLLPAGSLPKPVIEGCRAVARHLRGRHEAFYRSTADETEGLLADEIADARAEDLGKIDTFRFEERKVLEAALDALERGAFRAALEWEAARLDAREGAGCFWVRHDPARRSAWQLVGDAARLGEAIAAAGERLAATGGLDGALQRYQELGAAVDRAHRHLEQRRSALLYPPLPDFERLRERLDDLRSRWRRWADAWAKDFNALCKEEGFLPPLALQQRALFDEVVRPLTKEASELTAYFVVDALRYEMAEELAKAIDGIAATTVRLQGRFAELPTITAVGMNLLAPVDATGGLRIALKETGEIDGFSTGEYRVAEKENRRRAMHARVGGTDCPWLSLDEVLARDVSSLKKTVARARLVVVHSQEIDQAGENGLGLSTFDRVLRQLKAAWMILRDAGVRQFVFTADHGFLLHDESATSVRYGRKADPDRRHTISYVAEDAPGTVRVPLSALGYASVESHLILPETTAVFETGRRPAGFVHGGNSLQERVIPVLTILHRAGAGGSTLRYAVQATALEGVAGMHCLKAKVEPIAQGELSFGGPKEIELAMRVKGGSNATQPTLLQARGKARVEGSAVVATVGEDFELFFRLEGKVDSRELVELFHPGTAADVSPGGPEERFDVIATGIKPVAAVAPPPAKDWLGDLPPAVRPLFEHLAAHGTVTEEEAMRLLGSAREARRFAARFEEYERLAPFRARIDSVGGVKRYVREVGEK